MKKTLLIIPLLLALAITVNGQLDEKKSLAVDSLFISWNSPNHPGGAVGVVSDGKLVYSKAFGLASLEYLVPNSTGTRFNIASVSKEFTAMAIVKLQLAGKLNIDDDIRKYIPELPDFGDVITFRHCLHHTSGMRSLHTMLALAGWRGDDTRTNEDLLRFMTHQRDLNFKPGSEYMYCNTGYILMGIAVERITGEPLAKWLGSEIFTPLGMYETYLEDKYNRVVPNNATSYNGPRRDSFEREVEYWGYTGSGNIHSTTGDLLKWFSYFHTAPAGWEEAFSLMQTLDPFNDGSPNNYAFGVRIDDLDGIKRIGHSGSIGGFRAYGCTFPEKKTEIVVLTNFSSSNPGGKVNDIARILFGLPKPPPRERRTEDTGTKNKYQPANKDLKDAEGEYYSPELDTWYRFYERDGKLFGYHTRHGEFETEPVSKDNWKSDSGFISRIRLIRGENGDVTGMKVSNSRVRDLWMEKR